MKWSIKLARILGIDVYIHLTFVLLLGWIALGHYTRTGSVRDAVSGVLFVLAIFATVILHEFGHALVARRFGIRTKDITLLPIGGVARLERMPEKPSEELLVALAGPAVNVLLAILLAAYVSLAGLPLASGDGALMEQAPFTTRLLWVNVSLAIFNMIPAFPMDGGRALRALLAIRGDYVKATQTAAHVGQALALVLGIIGLFSSPLLVFIAFFVWIGAAGEAGAVQAKASLLGVPVHAGMVTEFHALYTNDTLDTATRALLGGSQVDFPVIDPSGQLAGVLTHTNLIEGLSRDGPSAIVGSVMERRFAIADPYEPLDGAIARLSEHGSRSMPVVQDGRVVGLVTMENVGELLLVRDALRTSAARTRLLREVHP